MNDDPQSPDLPDDPTGLPPTEPIPTEPALPPTTQMAGVPPTPPVDPNHAIPNDQPDPRWYENRAAVAAVIAVGLLGLFLLIGWLLWWSDDDADDVDQSIGTAVIVDGSTIPEDSTIPDAVIVEGSTLPTIVVTLPPETTAPPTTAPIETVPPTTAPTTTAATTVPTTTAPAPTTTVPQVVVPENGTIWDIIATNDDLSRARELIELAGLSDTLTTTDPITLFVPTNDAIAKYEAAGADLTDPAVVEALLLNHVAPERLDAAAVLAATEIPTIGDDPLTVDAANRTVNGANLVLTDVAGTNGFLHVVDQVLVPVPG